MRRSIPARAVPARSIPARAIPARSVCARAVPARATPWGPRPGRARPGAPLLALLGLAVTGLAGCDWITSDTECDDSRSRLYFFSNDPPLMVFQGEDGALEANYGYSSGPLSGCVVNVSAEASWSSDDPGVAAVGSVGGSAGEEYRRIRGVAPGLATITASYAGSSESYTVYVCQQDTLGWGQCRDAPLGTLRVEGGFGTRWEWLPDGSEIAYITTSQFGDDGAPHVRAVSVADGIVRTVVPPDAERAIDELRVVGPYVYARSGLRLYRAAAVGATDADPVIELDAGSGAWTASADPHRVAWTLDDALIIADPGTGSRDTIAVAARTPGPRLFIAPDGAHLLVVDSALDDDAAGPTGPAGLEWIDLAAGTSTHDEIPCGLGTGGTVRWEAGAPVVYGGCEREFFRHEVGGGTTVVVTIPEGHVGGAWSPALDQVTSWQHVCGASDAWCVRWDSHLWLQTVADGTMRQLGTFGQHTVGDPASAMSPALLSPPGAHAAFLLDSGAGGVYVVRLP